MRKISIELFMCVCVCPTVCLSEFATTTEITGLCLIFWHSFQDLQQCLFSHCSTCLVCVCVCGARCQFLLVLLRSFDYDTYTQHTHTRTHTHSHVKHLRKRGAFIVVSVSSLCNSIAVACLISIELLLSAAHTHTHGHNNTPVHTHTHACCNAYLTVDLTTFPKWLTFGSCTQYRLPRAVPRYTREGNGKRVTCNE